MMAATTWPAPKAPAIHGMVPGKTPIVAIAEMSNGSPRVRARPGPRSRPAATTAVPTIVTSNPASTRIHGPTMAALPAVATATATRPPRPSAPLCQAARPSPHSTPAAASTRTAIEAAPSSDPRANTAVAASQSRPPAASTSRAMGSRLIWWFKRMPGSSFATVR